ncbi:MFS transporter [Neobacillus mesonae]|uniref:CynX/NimT family MFS transporter n=1 Tax=Neobacillus mesonae TaxID=1193713 RepID=UPI00203BF7D4|nr:MFS transporter [Neobacillus mesonae]MCM3569464.1 MFS transporter [Neobacillus mesonae]
MNENENQKMYHIFLIIGIIFIAFNLRPAITSIGPIIGLMREDLSISNGTAGFITTLPLLSFAVFSILAPKIGQTLSNERTILLGLIVLLIGIVLRSTGMITALFLGTLLVGIGIAIGNVLLPGIVKSKFPDKVGILTSIYTTSMNAFAALGSGISIPLAQGLGLGWQKALAFWGILTLITIFIWVPQLRGKMSKRTASQGGHSSFKALWSSSIAWQVTFFMGLQSFSFYSTIAWIPEIVESSGMSLSAAGWMLSLMQIVGLPATFFAPVLAGRFQNQKGLVLVIGACYLTGTLGLIAASAYWMIVLSIVFIGVAQGASISLALTMIGLRTTSAKQAADLSGMSQSIGYLLAAIGPSLIGFLFDQTHSWIIPLVILCVVVVLMTIAGVGAARNQYVVKDTAVNN